MSLCKMPTFFFLSNLTYIVGLKEQLTEDATAFSCTHITPTVCLCIHFSYIMVFLHAGPSKRTADTTGMYYVQWGISQITFCGIEVMGILGCHGCLHSKIVSHHSH